MLHLLIATALGQVIELPTTPTLANVRLRALAGACVSLAESATCQLDQPAAVAIRRPGFEQVPFPVDGTLQVVDHPLFNPNAPATQRTHLWQTGANLKLGRGAVGLHVRGDGYDLPSGQPLHTLLWSAPTGLALGDLALGAAPLLWVQHGTGNAQTGAAGGGVWAPRRRAWRLSAAGRTAITVHSDPIGLRLPWTLSAGVGYALGLRNRRSPYGLDRQPTPGKPWVQLLMDVGVTGPSGPATGLYRARRAPLTPEVHLAAEGALLEERLRLRGGVYNEPARFHSAIWHGTTGVAAQLAHWNGLPWRLAAGVDLSPRDSGFTIGVETW